MQVRHENRSELSSMGKDVRIDTTKAAYSLQLSDNKIVEEIITETEYDKDSGVVTKKTETKRKVVQDTDQVVAKEGEKAVLEYSTSSLNHIYDSDIKVNSDVNEESIGSQESFGKWFGIIFAICVIVVVVLIWNKTKSLLNLPKR